MSRAPGTPDDAGDGMPPGDAESGPPDAPMSPPDAPPGPVGETQPLGMNDVSMVLVTPINRDRPLVGKLNGIDGKGDLIPRELFTQLVTSHHDFLNLFEDFHVFAVRFDLCDRVAPGPCPAGADGTLHLVLQPLATGGFPEDIALQAIYSIPSAELASVIDRLRAIARIAGFPLDSALALRPEDLQADGRFGQPQLRALVSTYATPDRLVRLSVMGQDVRSATPRTVFRQLARRDGGFVEDAIPTLGGATEQVVEVSGADPSYAVTPVADQPAGFALALSADAFNAATPADQRRALQALVATENPRLTTSSTVPCVGCHVSTYLAPHRGETAGIDILGFANRFATTRDVRPVPRRGVGTPDPALLHAFSEVDNPVAISQRVANETAMVLDDIARRFPVPSDGGPSAPPTTLSLRTGEGSLALASADLDGDGELDLVSGNVFADTVSVLLGNDGGTFQHNVDYPTGRYPGALVIGDVDGDGRPDVITADIEGDAVSVLIGNGDGTLRRAVNYPAGSRPRHLAIGDVSGDGKADLVVTDAGTSTVGVLLNRGDGTFAPMVGYDAEFAADAIAIADLDGDHHPDLFVVNGEISPHSTVSVFRGNGDGTFQPRASVPFGSGPDLVVVSDLDGDGKLDVVVANSGRNSLTVARGNGDASFAPGTDYVLNNESNAPAGTLVLADVTGDGVPDLIAMSKLHTVSVLPGHGDASFGARVDYTLDVVFASALVVADLDHDRIADLVLATSGDAVTLMRGSATGGFPGAAAMLDRSSR